MDSQSSMPMPSRRRWIVSYSRLSSVDQYAKQFIISPKINNKYRRRDVSEALNIIYISSKMYKNRKQRKVFLLLAPNASECENFLERISMVSLLLAFLVVGDRLSLGLA